MSAVKNAIFEFLAEGIIPWYCFFYRWFPSDSNLLYSRQNLKQRKHMREIINLNDKNLPVIPYYIP